MVFCGEVENWNWREESGGAPLDVLSSSEILQRKVLVKIWDVNLWEGWYSGALQQVFSARPVYFRVRYYFFRTGKICSSLKLGIFAFCGDMSPFCDLLISGKYLLRNFLFRKVTYPEPSTFTTF